MRNKKIVGHNTDIAGFELAMRYAKYDVSGKKVLIVGAGGVAPSIIHALLKMKCNTSMYSITYDIIYSISLYYVVSCFETIS